MFLSVLDQVLSICKDSSTGCSCQQHTPFYRAICAITVLFPWQELKELFCQGACVFHCKGQSDKAGFTLLLTNAFIPQLNDHGEVLSPL